MRHELQNYHRRIKLAIYYKDEIGNNPNKNLPFMPESSWSPPISALPPEVEKLISQDLKYIDKKFICIKTIPNLNLEETKALKELINNKNIIIKPADKGSSIVIMDREQYLWEGYKQLYNETYYKKLDTPIYMDTIPLVNKILDDLYKKKFINAKQKTYLRGSSEPRARRFYLLPKIHKEPEKWSKPHEIPPGRPIVSDCSSETYYTAEFIDHYLYPLSIIHKSYIKDTYDFVEKIKLISLPQDSILFTIDIDSLYTNIDIDEGINCIRNIFHKHPNSKRPDRELLQLLEINLKRNDFNFDGQFFLQIKGTAMGKKFAPAYANIFMAEWETGALSTCRKAPLHYFRYLDDIWGVWTHSEAEFQEFLHHLNTHNPSIKVKSTTSVKAVDFLDTTTYKGKQFDKTHKLDIKVFFKPTDTHALLFKTSYHPRHTFAGLVKSQLLRFHRICTQKTDFEEATRILFSALGKRGYSRSFLRACKRDFLESRPPDASPMIPLITTFSSSAGHFAHKIKNNFTKFQSDTSLLQNYKIITAYKRNKNLRDFLVHAEVKPLKKPKVKGHMGFFKQLHWVQNKFNKTIFKSDRSGHPKSKNCVYLITCKVCNMYYVGETGNSLLTRFTQHRYNILKHKETHVPLVQHFVHHGWDAVSALVLECNPTWSAAQRRRAERLWIHRLDTLIPRGLNER